MRVDGLTSLEDETEANSIIGVVTTFQFGGMDLDAADLIKFSITSNEDAGQKTYKGRMQYSVQDASSPGFALVFSTAVTTGCLVQMVYTGKQNDEIIGTCVRLLSW
jgi:hypothetical protein